MAQITLNSSGVASDGALALQSNGTTTAVTITTAQNVGIGTSSPASDARLTLASPTTESYVMFSRTNSGVFDAAVGNNAGSLVFKGGADSATVAGLTEFMRIDSSGNVGIGTTSPTSFGASSTTVDISSGAGKSAQIIIHGNGTSGGSAGVYLQQDASSNAYLWNASNTFLAFATNNTERMRIDSSGNLLVAKTATSSTTFGAEIRAADATFYSTCTASTNTTSTYNVYSTGASAYRFYVGLAGTIYATSTSITGISDQRLKENIRDLDDGLDKVMALKPRKFDWKEGKGADIKNARGFIAQEFETVFPDLIDEWKDPAPEGEEPYKSVRADLIPTLVKAIQEMKAIIDTQASTITALQADVAALKGTA